MRSSVVNFPATPGLWNPRESRMNGKSREAVEVNGRLEHLLLSIQSAYQSLIDKWQPFDATDVKGQFQGSVQARCRLIERLDMLIKEKESHIGIDIKEGSMYAYHPLGNDYRSSFRRNTMFRFGFSLLTENFIYELQTFCLGELGHQQSTFFRVAADLKTVCRLAYREGLADTLLFDKVHIERGDKKAPKALDKEALDKLKALRFDELEKEMEAVRDAFLFACYIGAAYCNLMELSKKHLVRDDAGSLWLKFNRQKTGVLCRIKLLPGAVRLIEKCTAMKGKHCSPISNIPLISPVLKPCDYGPVFLFPLLCILQGIPLPRLSPWNRAFLLKR